MRSKDAEAFNRGLERNGPRAVAEVARAGELWKEQARAAARTRHSG